jgi:hypothetical protein
LIIYLRFEPPPVSYNTFFGVPGVSSVLVLFALDAFVTMFVRFLEQGCLLWQFHILWVFIGETEAE